MHLSQIYRREWNRGSVAPLPSKPFPPAVIPTADLSYLFV